MDIKKIIHETIKKETVMSKKAKKKKIINRKKIQQAMKEVPSARLETWMGSFDNNNWVWLDDLCDVLPELRNGNHDLNLKARHKGCPSGIVIIDIHDDKASYTGDFNQEHLTSATSNLLIDRRI